MNCIGRAAFGCYDLQQMCPCLLQNVLGGDYCNILLSLCILDYVPFQGTEVGDLMFEILRKILSSQMKVYSVL